MRVGRLSTATNEDRLRSVLPFLQLFGPVNVYSMQSSTKNVKGEEEIVEVPRSWRIFSHFRSLALGGMHPGLSESATVLLATWGFLKLGALGIHHLVGFPHGLNPSSRFKSLAIPGFSHTPDRGQHVQEVLLPHRLFISLVQPVLSKCETLRSSGLEPGTSPLFMGFAHYCKLLCSFSN